MDNGLYVILLPGAYTSNIGLEIGACPRLTPGMFTDWQKYDTEPILSKVNRNLVGCK